jgi:plastocyanin
VVRRATIVTMVAALALALPVTPAGARRAKVTMGSATFSPDFKHVKPRTKVIWKNASNSLHNVTAYGGGWNKSSSVSPGARTSKKFKKKGTYFYRCTIHSTLSGDDCNGMCGVIHVSKTAP